MTDFDNIWEKYKNLLECNFNDTQRNVLYKDRIKG